MMFGNISDMPENMEQRRGVDVPIYALGNAEPTIDETAFVHPDAVIIGRVTIGAWSTVWPGAVLRGDGREIIVGERTSIQDGSVLHTTPQLPTCVGSGCVVGHMVHLEGCTVEDGCLIGNGSIVVHRAVVETGAIVGQRALVTDGTVVPSGSMAIGIPAKLRDARSEVLATIPVLAAHYVDRGLSYRQQLRRIG